MSYQIGTVPVYADESGEVYVDPEDVGAMDDEEEAGVVWPFGRQARLSRIDRRIARLESRRAALMGPGVAPAAAPAPAEEPIMEAAPADIYQAAAAAGMIQENQYNGLGSVAIAASGVGFLQDTINRNLWGKSLVLDSDSPASMLVTSITVAGLPVNVGAQGTPLAMFEKDSTRFGISFGRRLALTGQTFRVDLQNIDAGSAHNALGGIIADELNPYAMQRWMEHMLLTAATHGFVGPGFGY